MSEQYPAEMSPKENTGYAVFEWDGQRWHYVEGGNYCLASNVPPDPASLPPDGEPGTWWPWACVPYYGSLADVRSRKVSDQEKPGEATPELASGYVVRTSPRRDEYSPVSKLNLLYHVYPNAANEVWLDNVRQLRQRMGIFNGRKVVAIATGPGLVDPDRVQEAFDAPEVEYLLVPNDRDVGQVASYPQLLASVQSKDPNEASFYAHTKGAANGREDPLAIEQWRNAMYASLLDGNDQVRGSLRRFAAVGACKMLHPATAVFPSRIPWSHWHFAGTFFWFRHDRVFGDFRWPFIPHDYFGVEAWLGGFLAPDEACSLLQPRPETDRTWTAYDRQIWSKAIANHQAAPAAGASIKVAGDHRISVVIPCKGRLAHLRRSLPYWLRQDSPPHEIIVVAYGCPDRCEDWVQQTYPQIRVVRAVSDVDFFNLSRARNIGAVEATGDYVAFADADFIAPPDYLARVKSQLLAGHNLVCIAHYDSGELGLNGTCTVSAELFSRVRGYDETVPTYGFEDADFYRRCQSAKCSRGYLHNCQCMSHSDEERMRHFPEKEKTEAIRKSAAWASARPVLVNPQGYGRP